MSSNMSNSSLKQRRLNELRVVDLQKELQNLGVPYDKKELKGSLVDKLKQAFIQRNIDPDRYIFNEPVDSKPTEIEQSIENSKSINTEDLDDSNEAQLEIDPEPNIHEENRVQTDVRSSTVPDARLATTSVDAMNDDSSDHTHAMDTIDFKRTDDHENQSIFLTIDEFSNHNDDENNNDKMEHNSSHTSCSTPDQDLQADISYEHEREIVDDYSTSSINDNPTTADNDHQKLFDSGLSESQLQARSTEEKSNDDTIIVKSDTDTNQSSSIVETDKEINPKVTRNQSHLWVSNIAKETHAAHLKELFSKYGKVLATKVISSSSSQWFGYITMATPDDVEKCINALHQTELHGKKIHVDWDMHDSSAHSSSSNSREDHRSTSSRDKKPYYRKDYLNSRSNSKDLPRRDDSLPESRDKTAYRESLHPSRKRPLSSSNETVKKFSGNSQKIRNEQTGRLEDHDSTDGPRSKDHINYQRRNSSSNNQFDFSRANSSRNDSSRTIENSNPSRSLDRSNDFPRRNERSQNESPSLSRTSNDSSKSKNSSRRDRSIERRSGSSSSSSNRYRSSSIEKSRSHSSSNSNDKRHERHNQSNSKDYHRSSGSTNFDSNRRSNYHDEHRLRHEKELFERQQYVQHQEEEKIKEQQRRIAEERERVKREFEILERQKMEIERARLALEKEKQDQARELEKQRRLADEAKLRDEKLQRLAHGDNKRTRSSHYDVERERHPNSTNPSNHSNSARSYNYRSSNNGNDERSRNRSFEDINRSYYTDSKKSYTNNNVNNQRDLIYRDRAAYDDSEFPHSTSTLGIDSNSSTSNQRYSDSSTNQHRMADPFINLPPRGRDMALPANSSVSTAYDRSTRNLSPSQNSVDTLNRRPHSRDRFDNRDYMHDSDRRDPSSSSTNKIRREPTDTNQWDRQKPRDSGHFTTETHKYISNQYLSESTSSSSSSSSNQQGLWASAPPSRAIHHHGDLSVKHQYGWQQGSQGSSQPSSTHHTTNIASSHDRSRSNLSNNQRLQMIPSNQTSAPSTQSNRSNSTNQTHLYSHPSVTVGALSSPQQQHATLPPPPQALHHGASYVTQPVSSTGLLLHSSGQTRPYESHYVVSQPLPPQRRY